MMLRLRPVEIIHRDCITPERFLLMVSTMKHCNLVVNYTPEEIIFLARNVGGVCVYKFTAPDIDTSCRMIDAINSTLDHTLTVLVPEDGIDTSLEELPCKHRQ